MTGCVFTQRHSHTINSKILVIFQREKWTDSDKNANVSLLVFVASSFFNSKKPKIKYYVHPRGDDDEDDDDEDAGRWI